MHTAVFWRNGGKLDKRNKKTIAKMFTVRAERERFVVEIANA